MLEINFYRLGFLWVDMPGLYFKSISNFCNYFLVCERVRGRKPPTTLQYHIICSGHGTGVRYFAPTNNNKIPSGACSCWARWKFGKLSGEPSLQTGQASMGCGVWWEPLNPLTPSGCCWWHVSCASPVGSVPLAGAIVAKHFDELLHCGKNKDTSSSKAFQMQGTSSSLYLV